MYILHIEINILTHHRSHYYSVTLWWVNIRRRTCLQVSTAYWISSFSDAV